MFINNIGFVSTFALANFVFYANAVTSVVTINNLYYDTDKYLVNLQVGDDKNKMFKVALDTNSTLLWVHGIECPLQQCSKNRFSNKGPLTSKTYKDRGTTPEQFYSFDPIRKSNYIAGVMGTDTVSLEGLTVQQDFSPVFESYKVFKEFDNDDFAPEGVLGLGVCPTVVTRPYEVLKSVPDARYYVSFVRNLGFSGQTEKMFSMYLGKQTSRGTVPDSELVLGGFHSERIIQAPQYLPVYHPGDKNADVFWQIFGQSFKVYQTAASSNERVISTTCVKSDPDDHHHIITTKTSFNTQQEPSLLMYEEKFPHNENILFRFATASPYSRFKKEYNHRLYMALTGQEPTLKSKNVPNSFVIGCNFGDDTTKTLGISFSHQNGPETDANPLLLEIPLSSLVVPWYNKEGNLKECLWGPQDADYESEPMYLGQDVLRHIYMVFNYDKYEVGLAPPKDTKTKIIV